MVYGNDPTRTAGTLESRLDAEYKEVHHKINRALMDTAVSAKRRNEIAREAAEEASEAFYDSLMNDDHSDR